MDSVQAPSQELLTALKELSLCSPAEIQRSRRRVSRLARSLPAFDSVWIDALMQQGSLTPFQARHLHAGHADQLRIGPCVLLAQSGTSDGRATTYVARHLPTGQRCLLTTFRSPADTRRQAVQRLRQFLEVATDLSHPTIAIPQGCDESDDALIVVTPFVDGPSLDALLLRRGRYPVDVVIAVARQIVDGLARLEAAGLLHGDVRLRNVVLTERGDAVLLHAGVLASMNPELTIHAELPPSCYDGTAPERIGTGQPATTAGDLYAFGCLLWELVCGRPPFPTGDPLAKLAAHQSRDVVDVREWAPDTPAALAETIAALTQRDPERRPQSFQQLATHLGRPTSGARQTVARFRSAFDLPAVAGMRPGEPSWSPARKLVLTAAACLAMVAGFGALRPETGQDLLLQIVSHMPASLQQPLAGTVPASGDDASEAASGEIEDDATDASNGLALPTVPRQGVIVLDQPGPYRASDIATVGSLTVRGVPGSRPVIRIDEQPLRLWAEHVTLENVDLVADSPVGLLQVESQSLTLRNCIIRSASSGPATLNRLATVNRSATVTWRAIDEQDPTAGQLVCENVAFVGDGAGLTALSRTAGLTVANVLKLGTGPLFEVPSATRLTAERVTLRESGGLLRLVVADAASVRGIFLELVDCAFALPASGAALVELVTAGDLPEPLPGMQIVGEGSLLMAGTTVFGRFDPTEGLLEPLESSHLDIDGLLIDEFTFVGRDVRDVASAQIDRWQAIRRSPDAPGFDPRPILKAASTPYNSEPSRTVAAPLRPPM
ncbi:Serine/threonine-protein kinase PrkC [Maioricimonas rarisocia]|uniref:Serine/threonine-protein kinase PrkC n=1 Tax=Maioricimonas rarisocia TaxID=2528026 RepID=A0A517ZA98_9PLAN|nr:serine/threonine-protein kinase [Maioricimonas rarisocia]QDU39360.1 Serine/threonine-protein kinase PrkC [Maioricimonas rarisocia]